MRFKPINARGVNKILVLDESGKLVSGKRLNLRHTNDNEPEIFGWEHTPENDAHLKEYKPGQYASISEWGFYDIYVDDQKWSKLSPIFIPDNEYFQSGEFTFQSYGWFGDGSDGSYTLGEGQGEVEGLLSLDEGYYYSLLRDAFFENLTINADATLDTNGFRIFCRGTLNNLGLIHNSGYEGGNGGNASDGLGGSGGDGGVPAASGSLPSMGSGANGGAGATCPIVGANFNGLAGNNGSNGSNGAYALYSGISQFLSGGQGGTVEGYPDAPLGGNCGSPTATILASTAGSVKQLFVAYLVRVIDANGKLVRVYNVRQGNGGGGGGSTGTFHSGTAPLSPPAFAGSGGGGGGSGSDGGIVGIYAQIVTGDGSIESKGGNGGNGGNGSDGKRDNTYPTGAGGGGGGGGGNGGNGGLIYVVCNSWQFTGDVFVTGGNGGSGGSGGIGLSFGRIAYNGTSGANGQNGYDGLFIRFGVQ